MRPPAKRATVKQARRLRQSAPATERALCRLLRDRRLEGIKFRRQFPIGPFVVDFVCLRHRLVVEADGPFHDAVRDSQRDAWLVSQGFRVLRFPNGAINGPHDWRVIAQVSRAAGRPFNGDI
ncbi:endonuclease domain-containing protein [Phenylobacterium sp.]|uniref:endonuclease domain-containing protein n=1 Tax=Phenylobacterium sp. TaxID=1871053 RepID=UPI003D2B4A1A